MHTNSSTSSHRVLVGMFGMVGMFGIGGMVLHGSSSIAYAAPPTTAPQPGGASGTGSTTGTTGTTSTTSTGIGGFTPPSGARFDPSTSADPGLLDQPSTVTQDRTYGATGKGTGDRVGYDIIDPRAFQAETDVDTQVPDYHIVQDGDTLSGVCEYYYGDMYLWPKVWAYNPHITNPHWIFPGDRIRLTDPEQGAPGGPEGLGLAYSETYDPRKGGEQTYLLERYAFIDEAELDRSMKVIGGADAKVMMATLDTAYIGYDEENPPIPGERLSVYAPKQPVYDVQLKGKKGKRQKKGKRIGWLVEVVGEVYVTRVAEKSAEANIVDSVQPVVRGQRVGELKTRFARVSSTANEVTANGVVVETIRDASITGEEQFIIVNLGSDDGIRRGNTMEVVEKGDAYSPDHALRQPYEQGHPRRVLGNLLVLQVEEDSALAVVTFSLQELVIGNHVEITETGEEPVDHEIYDSSKRESKGEGSAEGKASAEDGDAEASGALRLGG